MATPETPAPAPLDDTERARLEVIQTCERGLERLGVLGIHALRQ
jgi:hypothetical protein